MLHEIGYNDSGTSTYACSAMHENIISFEPLAFNERGCFLEVNKDVLVLIVFDVNNEMVVLVDDNIFCVRLRNGGHDCFDFMLFPDLIVAG